MGYDPLSMGVTFPKGHAGAQSEKQDRMEWTSVGVFIYIHMYIIYMYIYMCVYKYICIYIYMCIYIYAYIYNMYIYAYIYIWYHIYPKNAGNLGLHKPERRWHPAKSGIGKIIHTWIHSTKPHNVGQNCILPIYLLYYLQSAATSLQTKPNAYSIAYISPPPPKKKTCLD